MAMISKIPHTFKVGDKVQLIRPDQYTYTITHIDAQPAEDVLTLRCNMSGLLSNECASFVKPYVAPIRVGISVGDCVKLNTHGLTLLNMMLLSGSQLAEFAGPYTVENLRATGATIRHKKTSVVLDVGLVAIERYTYKVGDMVKFIEKGLTTKNTRDGALSVTDVKGDTVTVRAGSWITSVSSSELEPWSSVNGALPVELSNEARQLDKLYGCLPASSPSPLKASTSNAKSSEPECTCSAQDLFLKGHKCGRVAKVDQKWGI